MGNYCSRPPQNLTDLKELTKPLTKSLAAAGKGVTDLINKSRGKGEGEAVEEDAIEIETTTQAFSSAPPTTKTFDSDDDDSDEDSDEDSDDDSDEGESVVEENIVPTKKEKSYSAPRRSLNYDYVEDQIQAETAQQAFATAPPKKPAGKAPKAAATPAKGKAQKVTLNTVKGQSPKEAAKPAKGQTKATPPAKPKAPPAASKPPPKPKTPPPVAKTPAKAPPKQDTSKKAPNGASKPPPKASPNGKGKGGLGLDVRGPPADGPLSVPPMSMMPVGLQSGENASLMAAIQSGSKPIMCVVYAFPVSDEMMAKIAAAEAKAKNKY